MIVDFDQILLEKIEGETYQRDRIYLGD